MSDLSQHIPSILEKIGRQEGSVEAIREDVSGIKDDVKSLTVTTTEMNNRQGHLLQHMDDLVKVYREQAKINHERIDDHERRMDIAELVISDYDKNGKALMEDHEKRINGVETILSDYEEYKKKLQKVINNNHRMIWWRGGFGAAVGATSAALWKALSAGILKF